LIKLFVILVSFTLGSFKVNREVIFGSFRVTYSTIEWVNLSSGSIFLSATNLCYNSSISSLLNKEPIYVVLASDSEDILVSFLHVRALCLVLPQFP
jgi:hypothetical protein